MPTEIPQSLSTDEIARLKAGEVVTIASSFEPRQGNEQPLNIECYLLTGPRHWILVTGMCGQIEAGFIDAQWIPEAGRGLVQSPHILRSKRYDVPHAEVRYQAVNDGFYVVPELRNVRIGQKLFDSLKAVLRGLQGDHIVVDEPSPFAISFYEEHNHGKQVLGGYVFELK